MPDDFRYYFNPASIYRVLRYLGEVFHYRWSQLGERVSVLRNITRILWHRADCVGAGQGWTRVSGLACGGMTCGGKIMMLR
jgi:hypothetical protein